MVNIKLNPIIAGIHELIDIKNNMKNPLPLLKNDRIDGRTCLVTGGNSGLGLALATELARRGGRVILAMRRELETTVNKIREATKSDKVQAMHLDLSRLENVAAFCDHLKKQNISLDICVLNAGIYPRKSKKTPDGFDQALQINFIANYVMLRRLLKDGTVPNTTFHRPAAREPGLPVPRIVLISSEAHLWSKPIDFSRFLAYREHGFLKSLSRYALSKLYIHTFICELARRLDTGSGPDVSVFSLCPGAFRSNIARDLGRISGFAMRVFPTADAAALPALYLCCSKDLAEKTQKCYYLHREIPSSPLAADETNGKRVWEMTERLLEPFNVL